MCSLSRGWLGQAVPAPCHERAAGRAGGARFDSLNAVHQHRADVERGEPEELLHNVDHSLQPSLVHAAYRPGADGGVVSLTALSLWVVLTW
jgi:hypothetical protein